MITGIEGKEEIRGQVSAAERAARFGHRPAVIQVEDQESALLLERELFDRGANVVVMGVAPTNAAALAIAGGLILIVTSGAPSTALDLSGVATQEMVRRLERKSILTGHEEQLIEGEGI
jgi:hypothetical protein